MWAHNLYHHIHSSEFLAGLRYSQAHHTTKPSYWQTGAELAWQAVLVLPFSAEQRNTVHFKVCCTFQKLKCIPGRRSSMSPVSRGFLSLKRFCMNHSLLLRVLSVLAQFHFGALSFSPSASSSSWRLDPFILEVQPLGW